MRTALKAVFVYLAVYVFPAWPQYGTGVILGTVNDPSGAAIPNARVTTRSASTNETRELLSDASGGFRFNALPSGTYRLNVTVPSFISAAAEDVVLRVNSQVRVDFTMQLGQVTETLEVRANTQQLQTNTAAVGTVVDNRTVLELPFNTRNFFDLVAQSPGVVKVTGGSSVQDGRSAEIGGVRNTNTNAMFDGVDFSVVNTQNPAVALSFDTIEEFKVQMNFMDASYGHGAAGIDIVSKRGSNEFHGVAYDFVRNRAFQAGQYFRPATGAPRFSYNQFGASAGGPIRKNRTFVFGNYEGRRRRTGVILQGLVPNEEMKRGDFTTSGKTLRDPSNSNQPFPGNLIPHERWDRLSSDLLPYFPSPNISRPGVNFLITPSDSERRDQFTVRADHKLSQAGNLFGRYTFADDDLGNAAYRVGKGLIRPDRTQVIAVGYTHLLSPTLISETRAGFTKAFLARDSDGDAYSKNYVAELGIKNLAPIPGDYTLPNVGLTGYAPGNPTGSSGFVGYGSRSVQNNIYYRLGETISWAKNAHSVRIGGDVSRLMVGYNQGSNQDGTFNFSGNFTGDSFGDYLLGFAQSATGGLGSVGNFGGVAKYSIGTQFQWYIQEDWKVTSRFTLNIGIRHETFLPWRGRLANFDLATGRQLLTVSPDYYVPGVGLIHGSGNPLLSERPEHTDYNNFAPRLGMAYRLGSKTVIRAGAGVFYTLDGGGSSLNPMTVVVPYYVTASLQSSNTQPQIFISQLFPTPDTVPGSVTSNVDLSHHTGYIYQYNLNVQHQLKPSILIETGYMGNTGQKQQGSINVNQPRLPSGPADTSSFAARAPFPALNPTFSQTANYQWSNYNAGFIKVEKRARSGFSYGASYTFSKSLDSGAAGQNMYDRRPERGLSSNDVRHNFIGNYVWELPIGRGKSLNTRNPVLNTVAGGWQINGITNFQSGMPFTISTTGDIANVATAGQRANATGVTPRKLDPRSNGNLGLDRSAYATPVRFTYGNLARNTQPGFGINNWDFSAIKNLGIRALGEAARLQLRFEWFNFFNHTQFLSPAATVNTPSTFGIVTAAADPRILQIAAKLYW